MYNPKPISVKVLKTVLVNKILSYYAKWFAQRQIQFYKYLVKPRYRCKDNNSRDHFLQLDIWKQTNI